MDNMRDQGGIQMLLTAEQEAQHTITAARNSKTARLKQAKTEAEKEVALYRSKLEAEYQKKLDETSGNSGSTVKRLEEETETKIQNLKISASKVQTDIIDMLINQSSRENQLREWPAAKESISGSKNEHNCPLPIE